MDAALYIDRRRCLAPMEARASGLEPLDPCLQEFANRG